MRAATALIIVAAPLVAPGPLQAAPDTRPAKEPPAPSQSPVAWQPHWRRVQLWEYAIPLAAIGLTAYIDHGTYRAHTAKWTGPILFDEQARSLMRLSSAGARERAATAADALWGITWATAITDSLIPLLYRDLDTSWQLFWIDSQVYAIVGVLSRIFPFMVRRARPHVASCPTDPDKLCDTRYPYASFWSGHTAMAAAAAGLTCIHHQFLPLYRNRFADAAVCAATVATSVAVGAMRMASDLHYASDTLLAGIAGFAIGYFYPWLFHFRHPEHGAAADDRPRWRGFILPVFGKHQTGLSVGMTGW